MDTHYDTVHLTEVASTQDESSSRFKRSGNATLVIADRQIDGRGRQGRSWVQADRAMFASYTHETSWSAGTRTLIPLASGVAMREALTDTADVYARLKWPNDLMLLGRKLGGILVEASGDRVTVGCGVNLWWSAPPDRFTAVYEADPGPTVARVLAEAWTARLVAHLARGPEAWPREEYLAATETLGKPIVWDGGEGTAVDIASNGALVVETSEGVVTINAGDIHTLR
jgi:BirA family biotin operon repressor/biotin-[acetyl-CoA-carboxylase] ligase